MMQRDTLTYLKEKSKGFYIFPEVEETSLVMPREIVCLHPPKPVSERRTFGFKFQSDIISVLRDYFS